MVMVVFYKDNACLTCIFFKRGEISYRYRLSGSRARSSVVKEDIAASNGVIHVVQKLLTNSADVKGDNSVRRAHYIFCLHFAV